MRVFSLILCLALIAFASAAMAADETALAGDTPIAMPVGASSLHFDESTRRLYVNADAGIFIFDDHAQPVASLKVENAASLVLALPIRRGYALDTAHNEIAVFDPASETILSHQATGIDTPAALIFEPRTTRLAVFGGDKTILLDAAGDKNPVTLDLGGVKAAVADGTGQLFAAAGDNEIAVIDVKREHIAHWALPPACGDATALALDDKDRRLFVACSKAKLVTLDSEYGRAETMLDLNMPGGPPRALAYDSEASHLFALSDDSIITIGPAAGSAGSAYAVLATTPIAAETTAAPTGPITTLALDQRDHRLFTLVPDTASGSESRSASLMVLSDAAKAGHHGE